MTVRNLLNAYEDKTFTDVVILDGSIVCCNGYGDDNILAEYNAKENTHEEWGRLSYFSTYNPNPLEKWFDYNVKSFTVMNDFNINGIQCIYITI